ncbi:MAG TPA: DUF4826 family protein [Terrimicrobiaceae bacterium]
MSTSNYDDPAIEERWCGERRAQVVEYLQRQGVTHGGVGQWRAWHIAPYVSIWAIESAARPEWVGWRVVCGDFPTDYISADKSKHPREAMSAIAKRWLEVSACMKRGETHPTIRVGRAEDQVELTPLLEKPGAVLLRWSNDDSLWGPEYD